MNGLKLRELLRVLNPATSIEITELDSEEAAYYRGLLLNLTYCSIAGLLEKNVYKINMRNKEPGYSVVIVLS